VRYIETNEGSDMPKMKTRKSAAKRFRYTGSGKVSRKKAYRSHLLTHKSKKRKRQLRGNEVLTRSDAKRVKKMLPYKKKKK
jgi:large subunit ribosomal protein L35